MKHPTARCIRCGHERQVNPDRYTPPLCIDCRLVEADLAELGCGTWRGYWQHHRRGEVPCEPCCRARTERVIAQRRRRGVKARKPAACGTNSGYFAHRNRDEQPCAKCRRAHSDYQTDLKRRRQWRGDGEAV